MGSEAAGELGLFTVIGKNLNFSPGNSCSGAKFYIKSNVSVSVYVPPPIVAGRVGPSRAKQVG